MAWALERQAGFEGPGKYGIPPAPPLVLRNALVVLKSEGFPKKSHCSPLAAALLISPVPLKSVVKSLTPHGAPLCRFTMELIDHPERSCSGALTLGRA